MRFHSVPWTHCLSYHCTFLHLVSESRNAALYQSNIISHEEHWGCLWYHFTASPVIITATTSKTAQCDVYNKMARMVIQRASNVQGLSRHFTSEKEAMCCASLPRLSTPPIQRLHRSAFHIQTTARLFSASLAMMSYMTVSYRPCALI